MSGETAAERWSPAQRVESVLLSIISLLDDAECSSPANVDAAVMLRKEPKEFKALVTKDVEQSRKDIPKDFVMPTSVSTARPVDRQDDRDFWYDTDQGEFGGSDTEEEMELDEDESGPDQESGNEDEDEDEMDQD